MQRLFGLLAFIICGVPMLGQTPTIGGVVNSFSFTGGRIAPGEIVIIGGTNLGDTSLTQCAPSGQWPTLCAGASVLVNGKAVPLSLVGAAQITFQAPNDLTGNSMSLQVTRQVGGQTLQSALVNFAVAPTAPGLITATQQGVAFGTFQNTSTTPPSMVTSSNPAKPGDSLTTYGTGFGVTDPVVSAGTPAPATPIAKAVAPVKLSVGGQDSEISFSGLAPAFVGTYQLTFKIPQGLSGNVQVAANAGGQNSPSVVLPLVVPKPAVTGVVSAGGFGGSPVIAPGTWIELYGSGLSSTTRLWAGADFTGVNAPTSLDGVKVTIGGQSAFVDYISSGQVNAQAPSNIPVGTAQVTVTTSGGTSVPLNVTVSALSPGLLAPPGFKIGNTQYVVAQFSDGTYVLPPNAISGAASRQAKPGETVILYGIGFGPVLGPSNTNIPAGQIATALNQLVNPLQIQFGTVTANVSYLGLAPNFVGLYQFNVTVPPVADSDAVPLTFTLNGTKGSQTLSIAVKQ